MAIVERERAAAADVSIETIRRVDRADLEGLSLGKLAEIAEYCLFDVKLTKLVNEYGVAYGHLYYLSRFGKKLKVEVEW